MDVLETLQKGMRYLTDATYRFDVNAMLGLYDDMSDEDFLKCMFRKKVGYELDLKNPKTYCEKLQWLKLHNRKPMYTTMVDKYEAKNYVANRIGGKYIIPTFGVWNKFDDIDFNLLPEKFVLKTTHDCGGVYICEDKTNFDYVKAKKFLNKHLSRNMFYNGREWPYKNVPPRIIAEKYLDNENERVLIDYKVLCFMGKPYFIEVHKDRYSEKHTQDFYDLEWNKTTIQQRGMRNSSEKIPKPILLDEMLECSRILSKDMCHLRVDWYIFSGQLFFGELTFYDASGFSPFTRHEDDEWLGSLIKVTI